MSPSLAQGGMQECLLFIHATGPPGTSSMLGTGLTVEIKKTCSLPLISSQYGGWKQTI